jgi:caffeoyl-CoA O-methyltransferase
MIAMPQSQSSIRPVTPLGILAEHLQILLRQVESGIEAKELHDRLYQALQLAAGLDPYLQTCTSPESEALTALAQRTAAEAWNQHFSAGTTVRPLEQEMLSGHIEGQVLKMFIHMIRARHVLEIGMFTGYSALAMAEALPTDGKLIACEVDPYTTAIAEASFQASPHGAKIHIELGSALETLCRLADAGETFDFVFIDADKQEYIAYFQTLLSTNLLPPGGFIAVDNTLLQGQPYLPSEQRSRQGEAIAQFNRVIAEDPRVEQVLLPLRDGLTLIRRI